MSALFEIFNLIDDRYIILTLRNQIGKHGNIYLWWIRAHIGVKDNERADYLAKESTTFQNIYMHYLESDVSTRRCIKREYIVKWQHRWNTSLKGKNVWNIVNTVNIKEIYADFYIHQIVTGHWIIPIYQARMFKKINICQSGKEDADANHIVKEWILWKKCRDECFLHNWDQKELGILLRDHKPNQGIILVMKDAFVFVINEGLLHAVDFTSLKSAF